MQSIGWTEIYFLIRALGWTIILSAIGFGGGLVGGLFVAILRVSKFRVIRISATMFIEMFQGTPLLLQLFVVYFGTAILRIPIEPWAAVSLGLCLHASALTGEIWRGCIESIPKGQWEAGSALGLHRFHQMRFVILPQAFRISLPPTTGFLVQLVKGTSLAALVGFTELTRAGQMISNATSQPLLVYAVVAVMYFVLCWPLSMLSTRLEKRLAKAYA